MHWQKPGLFLILLALMLPMAAQAGRIGPSQLPIPRFVSLKSDEVNIRIGPGTRYPINWVYRHKGLPVEVIDEFDEHWRKIKDMEGTTGWAHSSLIDGKRTVLIMDEVRTLRRAPSDDAPALIKAEPKVMGKLLACEKDWCRVQIDSRKGWIKKPEIWGVYPDEVFE